jgi:hypothetical protein
MALCSGSFCVGTAVKGLHGYCIPCWSKLSDRKKNKLRAATAEALGNLPKSKCQRCGSTRVKRFCGNCGLEVEKPHAGLLARLFGVKPHAQR